MGDRPRIDLYCEDDGHEQVARALLGRSARELGIPLRIQTASGRGGHGRAIEEFKTWQRAYARGGIGGGTPDLLVLMIDANCSGWSEVHRTLVELIDPAVFPRCAIGCPDPHVERWCLADPGAVHTVLGVEPPPDPGKCERRLYKKLLRETILRAGQPILTSEMEYAPDLIEEMDLYHAGKSHASLRHFLDGIRTALQQLR